MVRLSALAGSVRSGFWAVPGAFVLLAVAASFGAVAVDRHLDDRLADYTFGAGPDGAREVLSAITSSMITFTGLVFSITIVVLSLTSSQFSPRVLRTFLRDRVTQYCLGVYVATFTYSVLVLRTVRAGEDDEFVPALSTSLALLLLLLSIAMFLVYIHHISTAIQVSSIIHTIGAETRQCLDRCLPPGAAPGPGPAPAAPAARVTAVLPSLRSGVLTAVDVPALVGLARDADVVLCTRVQIGDYVPEGAPLMTVTGDPERLDQRAVHRALTLGKDRTMDQDVAFGIRQLVDIGEKALSPGINDPTTAVQALDQLHDLLRRLATRELPSGEHRDDSGRLRVSGPARDLGEYLDLALQELQQYGADSLQVRRRLRALLTDLEAAAQPQHRPAVTAWLTRLTEPATR